MTDKAFIGLLQAELIDTCMSSDKEEYVIPLSRLTPVLEVAEKLLNENFVSKETVANVLSKECSSSDILSACDLKIVNKDS